MGVIRPSKEPKKMSMHVYPGAGRGSAPAGTVRPGVDQLHPIALACAREFAGDYNDQQDLASQALLSVLQYGGDIMHVRQFVRTVVRNLCINQHRSIRSRELTIGDEYECLDEADACDPTLVLILGDTLARMEGSLTPGELRCYGLLAEGFEQQDLPGLLGVSRQAVSKMIASMRRKYLEAESVAGA
jgi:DNA-directed RNA polymerase specialized sigma24 family protein